MQNKDFIKQIVSKDLELSRKIIKEIIENKDINAFQELCEKSDFIFPFLKERIVKDFISFINKDNFEITFLFAKVYNQDFEEIVLSPWRRFANEDLTDEILDLFEKGTNSEKTFAAKYFSFVKDPLALEFLYKESFLDDIILRSACANTLKAFQDVKILDEMKDIISSKDDEFEKLKAYQFLISYGDKSSLEIVLKHCFSSPFEASIVSFLNDNFDFNFLRNNFQDETIFKIFNVLIENYPEEIPLDTIQYYDILSYLKFLEKNKNIYSANLLILARDKFCQLENDEIYTFDLDKNLKNYLSEISKYLKNLKLENLDEIEELNTFSFDQKRYLTALFAIKILAKKEYSSFLLDLINQKKLNFVLMAKTIEVLKEFNSLSLVDKNVFDEIDDLNKKALILSYFS